MSRDNQTDNLNANTPGTADSQTLSGNIWRDVQDARAEAPSFTKQAPLTIKDNDSAKPTTDLNLATGTRGSADVFPTIELYDSKQPVKQEKTEEKPEVKPIEELVSVDKAGQGSDASQRINNLNWETQSEELVGKPNQP